ncbi:glycosyltransferase family 39 protein [Candidatus Woesearchaeota archaeon]|nr:glycosyltransferase family 39 protein [Candidatus Woesearchaeota archaeon]
MEKKDSFGIKKSNLVYAILILFLLLGLYLRIYHLNYPSIGYHNMKENEYLDEAYFFKTDGNWLHKQAFAFSGFDEGNAYHEEYAEVPYVSYLTAGLWIIFGESIWLPRLFMIFFMLGSILMTYLVVKRLTSNEYLSLLSSFLITIMPLGIYFGRNVQPESPGLFLMLLTAYFFIRWIDFKERKNLMYSGFSFSIAWGLKYTFGIIAVPLFFIFPFREMKDKFKYHPKEFWSDVKYLFYGIVPGIITTLVYELTVTDRAKVGYLIDIFRIFSSGYWKTRWPSLISYFNDNYTMWFVWFAIFGFAFALLKYRTRFSKFLIGYVVSIFIYADLMAAKIGGHSYYQMPFLPLICILSAYFLFCLGTLLKQISGNKFAVYVPVLLIVLAVPSMQAANDRVWSTNFYGQDFIGEYLKTRLNSEERLGAATHAQDLAVCSYSKHRCGFSSTLEEFKRKEQVFNINYIYIGVSEMNKLEGKDPLWVYIKNNYKIDLIGLMELNKQLVPIHIVLKKGGTFNFNDVTNKQPQLAKTYDTKQGIVPYYYI